MDERYLFRGKRFYKEGWIAGCLLCFKNNDLYPFIFNDENDGAKVDPGTIGQCTGLRDKNNELIFEGDIVHDSYIEDELAVVTWQYGGFCVKNTQTRSVKSFRDIDIRLDSLAVVGNIHDNPV